MAENVAPLRGISELRGFFRTNRTPIYFISPTAFNLLGIDRWVRHFHFINYFDSFDGRHPCVLVPSRQPHDQFGSIEDVCNYLLSHEEVREFVDSHAPAENGGARGKGVFVFFDEENERRAGEIGLQVALPPADLRHRLDSKIITTQLGDEAGVPSVPNALGHAESYDDLLALASFSGLGDDLVVQTPYGDSGKTTFFIRGEGDWNAHAGEITRQELKVMRRIERRPSRSGVHHPSRDRIGPAKTDLTGYPELTPYRGGWCGNDIFPGALSPGNRERALTYTRRLGDRLAKEGYRGQLEVDYLVDARTGELYLGELNPRLSGISSMTNVSAGAYADMPLFLFHLAEYLGVDYELDVEEVNQRWGSDRLTDIWGQIILKEPNDRVELLTDAPATGVWRLDGDAQIAPCGQRSIGTRSGTIPRASTCGSSVRATIDTRALISGSSSPEHSSRPTTAS